LKNRQKELFELLDKSGASLFALLTRLTLREDIAEELMQELKKSYTIVIVTHNMQQAARTSDWTGFFHLGELLEYATTEDIFTRPQNPQTENYVTGRYG